ncbi:MAG: hypothetical protein H5T76_07420 [Streptomyces sp.]|nr:hypothetical protein [Streptomyces sp.]
MSTPYQQRLRERYLAVPEMPAPAPWRLVAGGEIAVGGLVGVGFAVHPEGGQDIAMVVSSSGHGLFDAVTGERIAREYDPEDAYPEGDDLSCPGLGPVTGVPVRVAGLYGGGLHTTAPGGWTVDVVSPDWPRHRVLLSVGGGGPYSGAPGESWWHVRHVDVTELRAAGFSPSGRTLVVATSAGVTFWTRCP